MKKSAVILKKFLKKQYMDKDGADNLDCAIRDCLTDMLHIINENKLPTDLRDRLVDAEDVYRQEQEVVETEVRDAYPDGRCPDCGEEIPIDAPNGWTCPNCGHACYEEGDTDA